MKENNKNLKEVLIENISFLEKALITFDYSYKKCININLTSELKKVIVKTTSYAKELLDN